MPVRRFRAALAAVLLLSGSRVGAADRPLAVLDVRDGASRNARIVGARPPIVKAGNARFFELSVGRAPLPLAWPADMPNPGFPGLKKDAPRPEPPTLAIDVDAKAAGLASPADIAVVATVWDVCPVNSGAQATTLEWRRNDPKRKTGAAQFTLCGDPFAADALARPREIEKTLVATGVLLDGADGTSDLVLKPASYALIRRIEVYALPPSPLDRTASLRGEGMISHPTHRAPESVLDLWEKDFSDLLESQTAAYGAWGDAETVLRVAARHADGGTAGRALREEGTLRILARDVLAAMDAFYYGGRTALVRKDAARYAALRDAAGRAVSSLSAAAARAEGIAAAAGLRRTPPEPLSGDRRSPESRVLFTMFANSPWDYWDPFDGVGRALKALGIGTKGYLLGSLDLDENGSSASAWNRFRPSLRREQSRGLDIAVGVGHHGYHLCEHSGLPGWLAKKSAPDGVMDVDAAGKTQKTMDIFNPRVRRYFLDSIEALAARTSTDPGVSPLHYFGEPLCGSGYSPAARRAFAAWLESRHGDIGRLNAAWGTSYGSFAEIQPPPPPGESLRKKATGLTYEFEIFRREYFVGWWKDAAAALRRGNPEAGLWFEGWGRLDYLLRHGMDQLGLFGAADIAAAHSGSAYDIQRTWAAALSRYSGTPLCDGETIVAGEYFQGCASLDMLKAAVEQNLASMVWYGSRLFMFWSGTLTMNRVYSYGGPGLYDNDALSPMSPNAAAIRALRRKSDLYEPVIRATRLATPEVGILYSSTSFINSWPYNEVEHETYPIHSWLYDSDYGYTFVHEDAVCDGRENLSSFKVIFAPWAMWLKPEAAAAIRDWVRAGGTLIASGPVGAFDQYGRPLGTILEPALGPADVSYAGHERIGETRLSPESVRLLRSIGDLSTTHFGGWAWTIGVKNPAGAPRPLLALADGTPVLYRADVGLGRLLVAAGPLGKNGLRRLAMDEVRRRVVPLASRTVDDAFLVIPRRDAAGRLFLAVVNRNVSERVTDTVSVRGVYRGIVEKTVLGDLPLAARAAGGRTGFSLSLAPGEFTVAALGAPLAASDRSLQAPDLPASPAASSAARIADAERAVASRKLEPAARAEAAALLMAARRYDSAGRPDRAARLAGLARAVKTAPAPVRIEGDAAVARRAAGPVVVDGSAAEWRGIERRTVKGGPGNGGEFAFQWDDDTLYILAVARDSTIRREEETGGDFNWLWAYDGVCLVLNTADSAPVAACGPLYDAKYRLTQTALLVSITGRKAAGSAGVFSSAAVRSAAKETEGGWIMEIAVPLADIMLPPIAGADVAMEFRIIDNGGELGFGRFCDRENWMNDTIHLARLKLAR